MSIQKPGPFDLLGYLLFLALIYTLFYIIPLPEKEEFTIVYDDVPEFNGTTVEETEEGYQVWDEETYDEYQSENEVVNQKMSEKDNVFEDETDANTKPEGNNQEEQADSNQAQKLIENGWREAEKTKKRGVVDIANTEEPFKALNQKTNLSAEAYFDEFARIYRQEKVKGEKPEIRSDVVIRYYQKDKDGRKIYTLEKLGFYIHERPTSERFDDFASNAIYYGASVSAIDIKMVTYTLMQNGVDIKVIKPSQFSEDWKSQSIEIGTDDTAINAPSITLEGLRQMNIR